MLAAAQPRFLGAPLQHCPARRVNFADGIVYRCPALGSSCFSCVANGWWCCCSCPPGSNLNSNSLRPAFFPRRAQRPATSKRQPVPELSRSCAWRAPRKTTLRKGTAKDAPPPVASMAAHGHGWRQGTGRRGHSLHCEDLTDQREVFLGNFIITPDVKALSFGIDIRGISVGWG